MFRLLIDLYGFVLQIFSCNWSNHHFKHVDFYESTIHRIDRHFTNTKSMKTSYLAKNDFWIHFHEFSIFHIEWNLMNRCIEIKEEYTYFHIIQNSSSGTNYSTIKKKASYTRPKKILNNQPFNFQPPSGSIPRPINPRSRNPPARSLSLPNRLVEIVADPKSSSSRRCCGRLRWELKSEDSRVPLHSLDRTPTDYQMRIRPAILGTNACSVRPRDLLSLVQSVQQEFELEYVRNFVQLCSEFRVQIQLEADFLRIVIVSFFIDRVNRVNLSSEKLRTFIWSYDTFITTRWCKCTTYAFWKYFNLKYIFHSIELEERNSKSSRCT